MNAVEIITAFAAANHNLPDAVRLDAERLLRDTLAVGIAGSSAPGAAGVLITAKAAGSGDDSRILASATRLPAPGAAFVNGFQIHCLEWDAVHEAAVVHALSVTTAALLAVADRRGDVTEIDFLEALCVGVDIASGIGMSCKSGMRFFRPATAGVLGAALACARLEGMSARQMQDVLGLAYSQVSGTMQAHLEGSMALPLQVAIAARAAVTAVDLVKNGITGPHDVLEGPFGFFSLIEPQHDLTGYLAMLGKQWLISDISTKPFPTGRASHGILSTVQELQTRHAFVAADIESITAFLPPLAHRLVGRPPHLDMTPAYARLCLPFLAAVMVTGKTIDPHIFTPAHFHDAAIQSLAARVRIQPDTNPDANTLLPQRVFLRLNDGRCFDEPITDVLGSPAHRMTDSRTEAKLNLCLALAMTPLSPMLENLLRQRPLAFAVSGKLS
jgi:2-methylcitrate dehydratase PrpD